jgi:hypothetical protein
MCSAGGWKKPPPSSRIERTGFAGRQDGTLSPGAGGPQNFQSAGATGWRTVCGLGNPRYGGLGSLRREQTASSPPSDSKTTKCQKEAPGTGAFCFCRASHRLFSNKNAPADSGALAGWRAIKRDLGITKKQPEPSGWFVWPLAALLARYRSCGYAPRERLASRQNSGVSL